ncbi:SPW repeat domain-containing protein [Amycolatopsis sp. NPDC004378]
MQEGAKVVPKMSPKDRLLREERLPAAVVLLAGVWLIIAPFALDYSRTFAGIGGYWNDVVTGVVVATAALFCVLVPRVASRLGMVDVIAGLWLIIAPFALGYPSEGHRDWARANDVVVGIVVAFFSVISVTVAFRRGRAGAYRSVSRGRT